LLSKSKAKREIKMSGFFQKNIHASKRKKHSFLLPIQIVLINCGVPSVMD
jgi:hypothetical protein